MADNVAITAGAGTTISTDDVGAGVQVQRVKVQHGADGSATDVSTASGLPIQGTQTTVSATTWTSATAGNTANSISVVGMNTVTVASTTTSTFTGGVLTFEVSPDSGTTWLPISLQRVDATSADTTTLIATYTLVATVSRAWTTSVDAFTNFRARLSSVITGTGTLSLWVTAQAMPIEPIVSSLLAAGTNTIGALTANQSVNLAQVAGATVTTGNGTATGAQRVSIASDSTANIATIGTSVVPGTAATNLGKAEDAVAGSGDTGVFVLGVQRAAPASNVSGTGDYAELQTSPANGLFVAPTPIQVLLTATPTVSTTPAYSSGDVVGAAMTFTGAALATARAGQVVGATLIDKGKQKAALKLWLFAVSPTLVNVDNGVYDITDANLVTALPIGVIDFAVANYSDTNSNSLCVGTVNGGAPVLPFVTSASANIFGAFSTTSTPTYASTTDLVVYLTVTSF